MDIILAPINSLAYRPGRVATIEEFAQRWRTEVLSKRKASTVACSRIAFENPDTSTTR
jgi:oligoribonuclease (3'-5' exoribonuclease)